MTTDDLVERVALAIDSAICDGDQSSVAMELTSEEIKVLARAAIAVVLEEAAKVAGKWQQMYFEDEKVHSSNITEYIVSDIRALIKEPT